MCADNPDDRTLRLAAHGESARENIHVVPVLVPHPELHHILALAAHHARHHGQGRQHIVRMDQAFPSVQVMLDLAILVPELLVRTPVRPRRGLGPLCPRR